MKGERLTHPSGRRSVHYKRACLVAILLFAGIPLKATAQVSYSVIDLGALDIGGYPVSAVVANDINDAGIVVGFSSVATPAGDEVAHAFRWQSNKMSDLGTLGGSSSTAYALNRRGEIVGSSLLAGDTQSSAVLWSRGRPSEIGGDAGNDINSISQIAGAVFVNVDIHAALWSGGQIIDLGTLGGDFSNGAAINDSGQVVGVSSKLVAGGGYINRGFTWANGSMTEIGPFGGDGPSSANDINNAGVIVGGASTSSNGFHALRRVGQDMTDLGTLGGDFSTALSINALGDIVGISLTAAGEIHPFVWSNGTMEDLTALVPPVSGWQLREAHAINRKGQIVGTGFRNGQQRAFLLTPNP